MTEEGSPFGKTKGSRHGKGPGQGVRWTFMAAGAGGWKTRLVPSAFPKTEEIRGQEGAFAIHCSKERQELIPDSEAREVLGA